MGKITVIDGKNTIDCVVKRGKRRRTMALQVAMNGQVTVMIPHFLNIEIARGLVEKKLNWINKQRSLRKQMYEKYPPKEFVSGESFSIFGRTYRLIILKKKLAEGYAIKQNRLVVSAYPSSKVKVKSILENLLRKLTIQQANEAVKRYAPKLGVKVNKLFAAKQTKRWGSCTRRGNIRINWKLAMVPLSVFNYVVAHEICHLKYHDHSDKFWHTLMTILPNYNKSRRWLKENIGLIASFGEND